MLSSVLGLPRAPPRQLLDSVPRRVLVTRAVSLSRRHPRLECLEAKAVIRAIVEVASRARDHQFRVGGLNCLDVEVKTLFGHVIVFGTLGKVEEVFLVFRIVHGTLKVFSRKLFDCIV